MRVVLDTNVLVSSLLWGGAPEKAADLAAAGRFQAITSPDLLVELAEALSKLGLPAADVVFAVVDLLSYAEVVQPTGGAGALDTHVRDPSDAKVLACALAGRAAYVVTGDKDLLVLDRTCGVRIVTPRAFVEMLGTGGEAG